MSDWFSTTEQFSCWRSEKQEIETSGSCCKCFCDFSLLFLSLKDWGCTIDVCIFPPSLPFPSVEQNQLQHYPILVMNIIKATKRGPKILSKIGIPVLDDNGAIIIFSHIRKIGCSKALIKHTRDYGLHILPPSNLCFFLSCVLFVFLFPYCCPCLTQQCAHLSCPHIPCCSHSHLFLPSTPVSLSLSLSSFRGTSFWTQDLVDVRHMLLSLYIPSPFICILLGFLRWGLSNFAWVALSFMHCCHLLIKFSLAGLSLLWALLLCSTTPPYPHKHLLCSAHVFCFYVCSSFLPK